MPVALLHPGVYIEEVPSGVRTITGVATSIAIFVGWAPRGPTDRPVRVTSFADYQRSHGGLDTRSLLGYSVRQFFENGGSDAYILRIASDTDTATAACAIGDLSIEASSPGAWANDYSVRLTRRPAPEDDRFRLEVLDTATSAVLEILPEPLDDRDRPALRAVGGQRPLGLHRQPGGRVRNDAGGRDGRARRDHAGRRRRGHRPAGRRVPHHAGRALRRWRAGRPDRALQHHLRARPDRCRDHPEPAGGRAAAPSLPARRLRRERHCLGRRGDPHRQDGLGRDELGLLFPLGVGAGPAAERRAARLPAIGLRRRDHGPHRRQRAASGRRRPAPRPA